MPGQQRYVSRIDTIELKHRIETRIGPVKSDEYFNLLNKYFSLSINKPEFDRLCVGLLGKSNISLHNDLLRAILKNASVSKVPPTIDNGKSCVSKIPTCKVQNGKVANNGHRQSSIQLLCRNVFPQPRKKMRTQNLRDREFKDRLSPLGPHGKKPRNTGLQDLVRKIPVEVTSAGIEDLEQRDDGSYGFHNGSAIRAPFGICLNGKGIRKVSRQNLLTCLSSDTCYINAELPDTSSLSKRLEQNLGTDLSLSVSRDCGNLLNNGLDMFIKRLLKPCLELAASRSRGRVHVEANNQTSLVNGTRLREFVQKSGNRSFSASVTDFRVAMESNPTILRQDWPVQLEKISLNEAEHNHKGWSQ